MTPASALKGLRWQGLRERLWAQRDRAFGLPVRDGVQLGGVRPARLADFDHALVLVVLALVAFGLVMVYSASVALPDNPKFARYSATFFLSRHLLSIGIGLVCALAVAQVPVTFWERHASLVFLLALVLLVAVLIPGIGKVVNFSRRWIPLGVMNFQPSEFAKLAIAMYAASYMVRKMDVKENFVQAVWPMVVALFFVGVLLLRQPDMGAFIVIATIAMGILFLGGVNGRMFADCRGAGGRLRADHRLRRPAA
jgi:cell division protein FtsW